MMHAVVELGKLGVCIVSTWVGLHSSCCTAARFRVSDCVADQLLYCSDLVPATAVGCMSPAHVSDHPATICACLGHTSNLLTTVLWECFGLVTYHSCMQLTEL
jgi:hypothetical protein